MLLRRTKPAAVALLVVAAACSSIQPVLQPADYFARKTPSFVVVTTLEADETDDPLVFEGPSIQNATLSGTVDGEAMSLPLARIRTLAAKQPDRQKTTAAVVAGGVALGVLGYLVSSSGKRLDDTPLCLPPNCEN